MALVSIQPPPRPAQPVLVVGRDLSTDEVTRLGLAAGAPAGPVAAATEDPGIEPEPRYLLAALALIVGGVVVGSLLPRITTEPFKPVAGVSMFAVFYVLAQALERLAELITFLIPDIGAATIRVGNQKQTKTKAQAVKARDEAAANALNDSASGQAADVGAYATTQLAVDKVRNNRALLVWAINSFLAAIGCALFGLYFLTAIGVSGVPTWLDLAITSLVVGGGTKPLHDLISNIEKAKEAKEDQAKTNP